MNLRIIIASLLLCILQACSSDDDQISPPSSPGVNSIPGEVKIESINFKGKQVTIDWNDILDNDNDKIYYKLYIDSKLIGEFT